MGVLPTCPPVTTVAYSEAGADLRTERMEELVAAMEALNGLWRGSIDGIPFGGSADSGLWQIELTLRGFSRDNVEVISGLVTESTDISPLACGSGDGETTGTVSVSGTEAGLDSQTPTCAASLYPKDEQVLLQCEFDSAYRPGTAEIWLHLRADANGTLEGDFIIGGDAQHVSGNEYTRSGWLLQILDLVKVTQ